MRINYDCMRDVLLTLEETLQFDDNLEYQVVSLYDLLDELADTGYSKADIAYSLVMLEEAGYIHATATGADDSVSGIICSGMTFEGHKYLDTVRSPAIWQGIKSKLHEKAVDLSVDTILLLGKMLITSRLNS